MKNIGFKDSNCNIHCISKNTALIWN